MSENSGGITPLNWRALVAEALRRRKAENLTQREHAALAGVSIPTIATFDRSERTLTLTKAFDILRVVGLVDEPAEEGAFVRDAFARWRELTDPLPEDSPGRFPHGWYRFDYALEGDLKQVTLPELPKIIHRAGRDFSDWAPFWVPQNIQALKPYEIDGVVECWLTPDDDRQFKDAAHCDFWRASPAGRMFLIRGFQEDGQEIFPPGTIFDATLPIWRLSQALLHAARLAGLLKRTPDSIVTVRFRALYAGLRGRVLRSWANPLNDLLVEGGAARGDEAILEAVMPAQTIEDELARYIFPLVASLYERFGVTGLTVDQVDSEIHRLRNRWTSWR